jgi:large subunit ribosomal protein L4
LIIDDLNLAEVKTKSVVAILKALKLEDTTCLLSISGINKTLYLSARNLAGVKVLPASELNAYTVLKQKRLVLTKEALEELKKKKTN